jgi:hypothetical protein
MKIIKLDRRYNVYREYNHVVAMRFPSVAESIPYRRALAEYLPLKHGEAYYDIDTRWQGWYSTKVNRFTRARPYFFSFRDERDLLILRLVMDEWKEG